MKSTSRKVTSTQIIRPGVGLMRRMLSSARGTAELPDEERHERHQEGVERDRLGQRQAEEHEALELAAELRLPADPLDRLADQVAHARARPDRAEARAEAERDDLRGLDQAVVG